LAPVISIFGSQIQIHYYSSTKFRSFIMKFAALAVLLATTPSSVHGFAGLSSFAGRSNVVTKATGYRDSLLMYELSGDPNSNRNNDRNSADTNANVWSVLATTEKWICETLSSNDGENGNPYSRKEVNYVCEASEDSPLIAANMFKRLREARELGQRHGVTEEDHLVDQGELLASSHK